MSFVLITLFFACCALAIVTSWALILRLIEAVARGTKTSLHIHTWITAVFWSLTVTIFLVLLT